MIKVFISQSMKGKTDEEILRERKEVLEDVKKQLGEELELLDSFFQGAPSNAKPLWYLGESLKLLSTADVAYFCKDWKSYRGCRIEHTCAKEYGIEVIEAWEQTSF